MALGMILRFHDVPVILRHSEFCRAEHGFRGLLGASFECLLNSQDSTRHNYGITAFSGRDNRRHPDPVVGP